MESMGCGASNNDNNSNNDNEEINLVSILNFHLLNEKKLERFTNENTNLLFQKTA